jgi:hypothetical protein
MKECLNAVEKCKSGIGIFTVSQLPQSGIGIPACIRIIPVPLVTD